MKSIQIHFDGAENTVFDFRVPAEGKTLYTQKALINIATEQGSDPIYPDRGTDLLASSINGLLIDKVEAQHAGNFAALDTLTFCNFNDYAAATKGSGDIITAMTIVPTSYDMDKRVLRFDVTMTFADGTSNPIRATVNG